MKTLEKCMPNSNSKKKSIVWTIDDNKCKINYEINVYSENKWPRQRRWNVIYPQNCVLHWKKEKKTCKVFAQCDSNDRQIFF